MRFTFVFEISSVSSIGRSLVAHSSEILLKLVTETFNVVSEVRWRKPVIS